MNAKWEKPQAITNLDLGFGVKDMSGFLPAWEEIPEDFRNERGEAKKWTELVSHMLCKGLENITTKVKPGIDSRIAIRHCSMILHSWEPKHEHKIAGVAYLLSLWFDDVQ